ncbi:MAG: spore germination protein, partial [Clostridia bacterium]|nr:spore germination protein [Clostridia bacterium]
MQYTEFLSLLLLRFECCEDLVLRESGGEGKRFALVFLKGITSRDFISERLLRPLLKCDMASFDGNFGALLEGPSLSAVDTPDKAALSAAKGDVVILAESRNGFFVTLAN